MVTEPTWIEVAGGRLAVHQLAGSADSAQTVIALHGITANGLSFSTVARALPNDTRLLAPDLRGRAESRGIPGPWGLDAHAADVIAVADALGLDRPTLLGHSMGAFVAALTAARHPDRVGRAVLVDGGVGFPVPPENDIDALLAAVIGPAMTRLSMTFPDVQGYLAFMAENPAVGEVLTAGGAPADDLRGYFEHDLITADNGELASSCVLAAIRVDGGAVITEPEALAAIRTLTMPTVLLWAPRGLLNQTPGLYTDDLLASAALPGTVTSQQVSDCNHYSILFAEHAVAAIVGALAADSRTAAGVSGPPNHHRAPDRSR